MGLRKFYEILIYGIPDSPEGVGPLIRVAREQLEEQNKQPEKEAKTPDDSGWELGRQAG
ncbi:MAG: hypothetical protein K0R31_1302 [Clostridiales bacterium]|jgi:hypothetical protein|nr:hypothetical protein [Clostridiales bacterium]